MAEGYPKVVIFDVTAFVIDDVRAGAGLQDVNFLLEGVGIGCVDSQCLHCYQ